MRIALVAVAALALALPTWAQPMSPTLETEPNNSFAEANDLGSLYGYLWGRGDQGGAGGDDYWSFTYLGMADAVVVRTSGGEFDSQLALYNSAQGLITSNDDYIGLHSGIMRTDLTPGLYYIREYPYGTSVGTYDLTIFEHKAVDEAAGYNLGDLGAQGFMVRAYLNAGETDTFWFNVPAGFTIENMGVWTESNLDLTFTALGQFDDDGGPGLNPGLEFFGVAPGSYSVAIQGYSPSVTGPYTLFIEGVPIPEPASLVLLLGGLALLRRR